MSDERIDVIRAQPVHFDHWCGHDDCKRWGSFGRERPQGQTEWRCMDHLASDYLDRRLPARN